MFKMEKTPAGPELFMYMAAILEATVMDKGNPYPLNNFYTNFSTHRNSLPPRIVKEGKSFRLTRSGMDYFRDRFSAGSRQRVYRNEVDAMKLKIMNGGAGWVKIPSTDA